MREGIFRRLRRSFAEFRLLKEPKEFLEPCDQAVLCEREDPDDFRVKPVSSEEIDGARKTEKLPVLSFELFFRPL